MGIQRNDMKNACRSISGMLLVLALLSACTPRVQLEAPDKPITINLNVKIEHEIKVKVDKDLDAVFSKNSGLF